jgi:hypothetical protein
VIDAHPGDGIGASEDAAPRSPGDAASGRLLEMLDGDGASPLTVLDAGVGYGKTTLVRSWCAETGGRKIFRMPECMASPVVGGV